MRTTLGIAGRDMSHMAQKQAIPCLSLPCAAHSKYVFLSFFSFFLLKIKYPATASQVRPPVCIFPIPSISNSDLINHFVFYLNLCLIIQIGWSRPNYIKCNNRNRPLVDEVQQQTRGSYLEIFIWFSTKKLKMLLKHVFLLKRKWVWSFKLAQKNTNCGLLSPRPVNSAVLYFFFFSFFHFFFSYKCKHEQPNMVVIDFVGA